MRKNKLNVKLSLSDFICGLFCFFSFFVESAYPVSQIKFPSRYLLARSLQWKHWNKVWNMFKDNNKDTKMTPGVFIVSFEHISHLALVFLLFTLNM